MTHIVVLATGGTIASRTGPGGASVAADGAGALLAAAGQDPSVKVEPVDVLRENSFNLTLEDLASIAEAVRAQLARPEVDGIVLTHGTDTIEETAFLLDLVHDDDRPVVLTGAQIAPDRDGSDGPRNLRQAIAVAAAPEARGLGVLVSFAGELFAARGLRKAHTLLPQPFAAQSGGPIGQVLDDGPLITARPVRSAPLPLPGPGFGSLRVETLTLSPGATPELLDHLVEQRTPGIVLAGTGSGNLNRGYLRSLRAAVDAGTVVALSSRVPFGPGAAIYGSGGAVDAIAAGAVPATALPFTQTRILLALLLSRFPADDAADRLRRRANREKGI